MKFTNHKYTWRKPFSSVYHDWELVGPNGAINYHVSLTEGYGASCGLEFHYCAPPHHMKNDAPSHVDCKLTGGRCWHDGPGLYASEIWPSIEAHLKRNDHETIFKKLEYEYLYRVEKEEEQESCND